MRNNSFVDFIKTLRFTARSLQIKILILFTGVNRFFWVVLVDCNAAIHLFAARMEKRFLWNHVGCQHSSYESLFSASTQRKHTGCWRVVGNAGEIRALLDCPSSAQGPPGPTNPAVHQVQGVSLHVSDWA